MGDPETETIVRAYVEACNGDAVERVLALLHPEFELHEADALPGAVDAVEPEQVERYFRGFEKHWSRFEWTPLEVRVEGERALMRARLRLEGRRSGITIDREWLYLFVIREGKLLRQYGFDDAAEAERALESAAE